jgi:hypothetical protein
VPAAFGIFADPPDRAAIMEDAEIVDGAVVVDDGREKGEL